MAKEKQEKQDALTSDEKEPKKAKAEKADKQDKQDKKEKSKSKDKPKKDKNTEKKSGGVGKWFKDLKTEFRLVTWPTKQTVMVNSGIVLGTIIISSIFVGLLDTGLLALIKFLLSLGQNA